MIPYFTQPSLTIGPLTIHAFGVLVALAVGVGLKIGAHRFTQLGLDRTIGEQMATWLLAGGFLGAHLFAVLFYFPQKIAENPLVLLKVWEDISSFGSIIGGILAIWLFFQFRVRGADVRTRLAYLDVAAFVFPISLLIGRIGCALAHDHPGIVTASWLGISLETPEAQRYISDVYAVAGRALELPPGHVLAGLGFHDLGLLEALYLGAVAVPALLYFARRPRQPGFFLAAFAMLYMPVRFTLDFLRVSDVRYGGLTPAQWVAIAALFFLLAFLFRPYVRRSVLPLLLAGAALACGSEANAAQGSAGSADAPHQR